jgi:hypothetical protein
MPTPADTPLLPDPDRLRARLAELAREQAVLRKVLRAVRGQGQLDAGLSLTVPAPKAPEERDDG